MNDASADQGVEDALAHIDTGWPLVMTSDPAGPRRDFLLLSGGAVSVALIFGLIGLWGHDLAMIAVFGGTAVLSIIGSYAMTRLLARPHQVALSTIGIVHEEQVKGVWRRQYAYRWHEISQVTVDRIGRSRNRICHLQIPATPERPAESVPVPNTVLGKDPERTWAIIIRAHQRYAGFSRQDAAL